MLGRTCRICCPGSVGSGNETMQSELCQCLGPTPSRLYPQAPLEWTNVSWHCPSYIANGGLVLQKVIPPSRLRGLPPISTSYAYNAVGMVRGDAWPKLGLGRWEWNLTVESAVQAPSEMYVVADAGAYRYAGADGMIGRPAMEAWLGPGGTQGFLFGGETAPPHSQGYNILFGDEHVSLVKRSDYLFPRRLGGTFQERSKKGATRQRNSNAATKYMRW